MRRIRDILQKAGIATGLLILCPNPAWSLQVHNAPEGYIAHQLAHLFFLIALGILAYWLRSSRLVKERGWRHIQRACLLFLLWNAWALAGHWVARDIPAEMFLGSSAEWNQRLIVTHTPVKAYLYYIFHLDNLLCAPAILLLFLGVRQFYKEQAGKGRGV